MPVPDKATKGGRTGKVQDLDPDMVRAGVREVAGGRSGIKVTKKTGLAGADPSMGTAIARGAGERLGARYRTEINVPLGPVNALEAGYTQANSRIVSSAINRTRENFWRSVSDTQSL